MSEERWEPWPPPDVFLGGGPESVILQPEDLSRLKMPTSGPVGFTVRERKGATDASVPADR